MNSIVLMGRTTSEIELKQTQAGKSVASFTLAVKRPRTKDQTDFIAVVAWDKQAELLAKYITKGKQVCIRGYLTVRTWTDKDGSKRYATEVIADEVSFVGSNDTQAESKESAQGGFIPGTTAYMPTAYTDNAQGFEEIPNGDSLPF